MGIEFPARDPSATAAMVDSMSAPEWRDSEVCERCRTPFSFTNRKHHCRNCGGVFDGICSTKKRALAHYGVTEPVRICDGCDRTLNAGNSLVSKSIASVGRRNSFSGQDASHPTPELAMPSGTHHRSATLHSGLSTRATHRYTHSTPTQPHTLLHSRAGREDADLQRAIALSLQETECSQPSQSVSRSAPEDEHPPVRQDGPSNPPGSIAYQDEANDPALAAAIAASLRDVGRDVEYQRPSQPSAPLPASPLESLRRQPSKPVRRTFSN